MSPYRWSNCPSAIRAQVEDLLGDLHAILGDDLLGLYLHGSLAMGCFHPERSDVDLLVITRQAMSLDAKRRMAQLLLERSKAPRPIEISFLQEQDLHPWRYPMLYDFHFSEDWRERFKRSLASGDWQHWNDERRTDTDLAAHVKVTRERGLCLYGPPISEVFPPVPPQDYLDAIVGDFDWATKRARENPVYLVLNACRIYAYILEGRVVSKDEGGEWALHQLPQEFHDLIAGAMAAYRSGKTDPDLDPGSLAKFIATMAEQLRPARNRSG